MIRVRSWQHRGTVRGGERRPTPSAVEIGIAARFQAPRAEKSILSVPGAGNANRESRTTGHRSGPQREKSGSGSMTTHSEALGDYQRYRERGAAGGADPPPVAQRPAPDPTHQDALQHASRLLVPSYRQAEQARAREAEAERRATLPEPRESLRTAHRERADAKRETENLQQAVNRARAHLDQVTVTRDEARQSLEAVEAEHTAQLIDELATGAAGRVEPVAGEKRVALAEAEHQVEIANRAVEKLAGDHTAAEQRVVTARAKVETAICAVLLEVAQREADALLAAADELDQRRANLDSLGIEISNLQRVSGAPRTGWPPQIREALSPELRGPPRLPRRVAGAGADMLQRWSEVAAALMSNPEAEIT
jgi:hypothetical protein